MNFSMVLTEDGNLYVAGSTADGRLGLGKTDKSQMRDFKRLEWFTKNSVQIGDVSVGGKHCLATSVDGDRQSLYMWGCNEHG
jgi:alpha-tubulin suppressor-like RCC1 family protein